MATSLGRQYVVGKQQRLLMFCHRVWMRSTSTWFVLLIVISPCWAFLSTLPFDRVLTNELNESTGRAFGVGRVIGRLNKETQEEVIGGRRSEDASVCIIGGGVSGLTAAITVAESIPPDVDAKIVLLEGSPTLGGRVQSDRSPDDGFVFDRGFAVFIDAYPQSKALLNYDALKLGQFLPGALVKLKGRDSLGRVADPIRQPAEVLTALLSPVGTLSDKVRLFPLLVNVLTKSVVKIFDEEETDTLTCLKERYRFSEEFIDVFFKPFLEGIYLCPLEEQSSRMFHFVFKMFTEGSATLPLGGMGAVSEQLVGRAKRAGVDIRVGEPVSSFELTGEAMDESFAIQTVEGGTIIRAKTLIVATDGQVAQRLLSTVNGLESLGTSPEIPQRSVGCIYYSFDTEVPIDEPILILNGMGAKSNFPVNNVCFPSVVNDGYAPPGSHLCSVTILKDAMDEYRERNEELDSKVREQLATWFPQHADDIKENWVLRKVYDIPNAQPAHFGATPFPANVNGGRDCTTFRGEALPKGLLVCGDHMATATLNGALESGVNAGMVAVQKFERKHLLNKQNHQF